MASQLQELVKKVFGDESTKAKFISNPNSILSQFRLTADEKRAVLATHAKLGLVDGDSAVLQADVGPMIWWQ
jgi:hypothetical protein